MDRRTGNIHPHSQRSSPSPPHENRYPHYGGYSNYDYYHNPSQNFNPTDFSQPEHPTFGPPPSGSFMGMLTNNENVVVRLGSQSQPFVVGDDGNDPNINQAIPSRATRVRRGPVDWTDLEDELVISAWLNVSKDPIVGTGQRKERYEIRLFEYFCEAKANQPDVEWPEGRTAATMKARWKRICKPVTEFCSAYGSVVRRNPSGCSEVDYINQAKETYKALHGKDFTLENCWRLLRHEEKWKMHLAEEQQKNQPFSKRTKNTASGAYTSSGSNSLNVPLDDDDEEPPTQQTPTSRPPGRDASKRKARGKGKAATSSHYAPPDVVVEQLSSMSTNDDKRADALSRLAELKAQQLKVKQRELDLQIINMDLSKIVDDAERETYMKVRQKAWERLYTDY